MLGLVVEEPGGEAVFGVQGIAVEAFVDEVRAGLFAVDELLCDGNGFYSCKTSFYVEC